MKDYLLKCLSEKLGEKSSPRLMKSKCDFIYMYMYGLKTDVSEIEPIAYCNCTEKKGNGTNPFLCSLQHIVCLSLLSNHLLDAEAVHRYYESRRRLFNDEQPQRKEVAIKVRQQSRKNTLRKKASLFSFVRIKNY